MKPTATGGQVNCGLCSASPTLRKLKALEGMQTIYTYNGSRFDLHFIYGSLGIDLASLFAHHDLMYDC